MGQQVCQGAILKCSFGTVPAPMNVLPIHAVMTQTPAANIMDNAPFANIPSFGMCSCAANPSVASATAAAMGVLTPMPCVPVTAAPWVIGVPTVLIGHMPALDNNSKLFCSWGGLIEVVSPGQVKVQLS